MFVFPHSGGFGYQYNFFKQYSFDNISEVFTYDYPRNLRENDNRTVERVFSDRVNNAVKWILEHDISSGNYVIFGHSLGALIAYEAGIKIKNDYGLIPRTVVMSSQNPPVCFQQTKKQLSGIDIDINDFLLMLGGMNRNISKETESMKFYMRLLNDDLNLIKTYEPSIVVGNAMLDDMLIFYSDNDPVIDMKQWKYWDRCALNHKIFFYEGNHFYIYSNKKNIMKQIDENILNRGG